MRIVGGSGARVNQALRPDWGWVGGVLLIAAMVAAGVFMAGRDLTFTLLRRELMAMARTAAAYVDRTAVVQIRPRDEETEAYARLRRKLDLALAATPGVRYAYLLSPTERPDRFRFLVDTDRTSPAAIGEALDAQSFPALTAAVHKPSADRTLTTDRWGQWLSGYAPVKGPLRPRKEKGTALGKGRPLHHVRPAGGNRGSARRAMPGSGRAEGPHIPAEWQRG